MQFFDRVNAQLKQVFREAEVRENLRLPVTASLSAALLVAVLDGKISQYARSGFREKPTQGWKEQWQLLQAGIFAERKSAFRE